ncbi:MAG: hypothetical protein KAI66_09425, partial [Lentisphaeria bacterium]|nr:hypothetical protein [Lentisphaeria bacterium]
MEATNTLWFDGFSRVEFKLGPEKQAIRQLKIAYKVKPEFSKFHTMPRWRPFQGGKADYAFTHFKMREFSLVWLMGDTHGFCWVPENEGNWVHAPGAKPIHIRKTASGAEVVLDLISEPVAVPANLTYAFGFIATPTRPLPKDFRTFATSGWNLKNTKARSVGWGGRGFTGYATMIPAPESLSRKKGENNGKGRTLSYEKSLKHWFKNEMLSFPYCSPTGLCTLEPVVRFYKDCWQVPGLGSFSIHDVYGQKYHQVYLTETTLMRDFFANKIEQLMSRQDKQIGGVYYDLCFVMPVRNPLVGGEFIDAFGRKIPSRLNVLELRECLMRTLKICRKYGKRAWYHGHAVYNPAVMGLGDFWYPGEHLASALAANPYYYADDMPQEVYETEFNSYQKGVGIINLPVIGRIHRERSQNL